MADNPAAVVMAQPVVIVTEPRRAPAAVVATGPQGPAGAPGSGQPGDYFQVINRFGELDTEQAKAEARANLDLQYIDGGTFN
ncbi:hypothetical protein LJR232_004970 [Aquipseudomonas alcaligenes]